MVNGISKKRGTKKFLSGTEGADARRWWDGNCGMKETEKRLCKKQNKIVKEGA